MSRVARFRVACEEWWEMYFFWLACRGKKDNLTNLLKFMVVVPAPWRG